MAAVASVSLPSTRRRALTLPLSSTTALRTTVPSFFPGSASAGYFAGTLYASRFSAPLEDKMIAESSPGSGAVGEVALELGLLSGLLITGAAVTVLEEAGGAAGALGSAGVWVVVVA